MSIERWEPIHEMISLRDAMNSLLADSFVRPGTSPANATGGAAVLPLDVAETDGAFVIKASLPGIKPEDVKIIVHGDTLTIRGESTSDEETKGTHWHIRERRVNSLARSLTLRTPINSDAAVAQFDHGVLTLTLPKTAQAQPKQIAVKTGSTSSSAPAVKTDAPAKEPATAAAAKEHAPSSPGVKTDSPTKEPATAAAAKAPAAAHSQKPSQKPQPSHDVAAEQTREAHEAETARNATASAREHMVDIGRGNQQAGRQGQ